MFKRKNVLNKNNGFTEKLSKHPQDYEEEEDEEDDEEEGGATKRSLVILIMNECAVF